MKILPFIFYLLYHLPSTLATIACFSQNKEANVHELYIQGKFEEAINAYENLLKNDPQNPYLFYNIANAYMKLNKIGHAIANYSKAFNLLPRNSDIKHNLAFAMTKSGQKLIPEGVPAIIYTLYYFFSYYELKALAIIFFWLVMILSSIYILNKNLKRIIKKPIIACTVMFILTIVWLIARATTSPFMNAGVIIEQNVSLLSGPGKNFTTYTTIPQARLVKIIDSSGDYYEIGIPQEQIKGWVPKTSVEKI